MARGHDEGFQQDFAIADLAHLKGNKATAGEDPVQLAEGAGHRRLPVRWFFQLPYSHLFGVNAVKPAAQPVVCLVVDDVQKGRRGNGELDGFTGDGGGIVGRAGYEQGDIRRQRF